MAEEFIRSFADDFSKHGYRVIEQVRQETPAVWLKIASDLLPKELAQKAEGPSGIFANCETQGDVARALLDELSLDEALAECDTLRAALVLVASERAISVK